jgi:hypothetical protein
LAMYRGWPERLIKAGDCHQGGEMLQDEQGST